jgi:RNA 3'-terminal phosphate cyclase-like protein
MIAGQYDQAPLVDQKDGTKKRTGIGFGISLIAETSSQGVIYFADEVVPSAGGITPEEVGKKCALQLLETIERGGCVTRTGALTALTLMAMGSEDVGRIRLGRDVVASEEIITLGRDLKKFGASSWGLRDVDDEEEGEVQDIVISVKGTGVGNVGRKIT